MSLPKRDGVHDRYYLIHKPDTAPEVLAEAAGGLERRSDYTLGRYIEKQVQGSSLRSESGTMGLQRFPPVRCGRSYGRRMWTKGCCASPAMWRSAIRCMD